MYATFNPSMMLMTMTMMIRVAKNEKDRRSEVGQVNIVFISFCIILSIPYLW